MDDTLEPRQRLGPHGHDVAAVAERHVAILEGRFGALGVEEGFQDFDDLGPLLPDFSADRAETWAGVVVERPLGGERPAQQIVEGSEGREAREPDGEPGGDGRRAAAVSAQSVAGLDQGDQGNELCAFEDGLRHSAALEARSDVGERAPGG